MITGPPCALLRRGRAASKASAGAAAKIFSRERGDPPQGCGDQDGARAGKDSAEGSGNQALHRGWGTSRALDRRDRRFESLWRIAKICPRQSLLTMTRAK